MDRERFLGVEDIMIILDVKKAKGYNIIRRLNDEIHSQGYLTVKGRVPTNYFMKRYMIRSKEGGEDNVKTSDWK